MAKTVATIFLAFFCTISSQGFACETDAQKHQAASLLYQDTEFRDFTCGNDTCSEATMESYLDFRIVKTAGEPRSICFATSSASVKNRYQGIFTFDSNGVALQFVTLANDIKVSTTRRRHVTLSAFQLTDDTNGSGAVTTYEWTGKAFEEIGQRNVTSFNAR